MSSSVFKVYSAPDEEDRGRNVEQLNLDDSAVSTEDGSGEPTSSSGSSSGIVDERLKIDSNLVIVVGKDGSVHVDQKTLHDLLANETTDTSVSVVRIASPTPSIEDEIEQERRAAQEAKLQQDLEAAGLVPDDADTGSEDTADEPATAPVAPPTVAAAGPSGVATRRNKNAPAVKKEDVLLEGGDPPHVSLMVEGFYPPEEAKKFAEEVLTLAGLRKPLTVETEPVDYEFQRYVVANDHCYTPLTSPSQKLPPRSYYEEQQEQVEPEVVPAAPVEQIEEGASGKRRVATKVSPTTTATKSRQRMKSVSQREESSSNDAEDLQSILEGSDSDYSEESSYPEEDDNESDLDFDISGKAQSASKKRKSGSKNRKKKADEQVEAKKKAVVKSPTKKVETKLVTPVSMVTKSAVPKTYGPKKPLEVVPVVAALPVVPVAPPVPVVKKVKPVPKPAPHVEALFSDMTSLFSTPDIIKKVGQSKAVTPTTPTPSSSRGFVQLSKGTSQKLPAQISIQTHTSASEENLIDVLAAQDPEPTASTTPTPLAEDIVKMLENNLPPGGVQEPVLPITDNSILAALGSNDDGGLPEDLLQHVAELAENKELQEILDKQVLGVIADVPPIPTMPSTSAVMPIAPQQMLQPAIAPPQPVLPRPQPQPQTPTAESLPTMTVKEQLMPRKEAIQIRRSDGRIITLPPIEAPATRSKRRAQTTPSSSPAVSASPIPTQPTITTPSTPLTTPQSSKSSINSKASTAKTPANPIGITSYDDGSGSLLIDESRGKAGNRSGASSRRTSESSNNSGRGKRQSTAAVAAVVAAEAAEDEVESDESWNSEDDPDRLWCICRQPHNNRFMICCDVCEDWFHGKCVNITKAMGQQMEADGIEWTCPNCLKKKQDKQQPKMTDFLVSSSSSASSIGTGSASITMSPKTVANIAAVASAADHTATTTSCVVCGRVARANSVYCSDACIRKHAGISSMPKAEVAQSAKVSKEISKQQMVVEGIRKLESSGAGKEAAVSGKNGPIIVMERKTGRCLTGKNAPTAENLKAWLQSHPTFEVVPPGSPQAAIILAKQAEVRKLQQAKESQKKSAAAASSSSMHTSKSSQSQSKHSDKKNALFSPSIPQKVTPQQHVTPQSSKAPSKTSSKTAISTPTTTTTTTTGKGSPLTTAAPKTSSSSSSLGSSAKTPSSSSTTTTASKSQKRPATTPDAKSATTAAAKTTPPAPAAAPGGENIRVTVKKTLKEHLLQRTSEIDSAVVSTRLTESEIDKFVAEVEEEMFAMFNKDTGTKYRAKYRTLVFNIKDRKNLSLFQKICEKRIEGKQLVRMTPEELASQELAQWRENEAKHQLEMIKKSELDLLACAKNYVLKTHKGEEVIEGKIDDRVQLDPTTAVEDVVAVLNNSTVSSTSELDASSTKDASFRSKDFDLSFGGKYSTGLYGSGSITSSTLASNTATSSTLASKKKDSRRSRSRSRSRERRRDRSRDRSRSRHKRRRSRSRSRHGSRDRDRARSHHRDHKKQDSKESRDPKLDEKAAASVDRNEAVGKPVEAKKPKKPESKSQVPESGNLIDQILASAGAAVNKPSDASTEKETTPVIAPEEPPKRTTSPISATTISVSPSDNQDQEPTSTVTIPTPPHSTEFDSESPSTDFGTPEEPTDTRKEALKIHWTGNVHMVDVASVEMSIRSVSGNIEDVAKDFSEDLDICGTIKPEIVWDYIGQIKKSANKEICLVRFHSNERAAYYTLYTHLFSRKRYSVIKSPSKAIKDFYVFPLPSEQMIPMILKPLNGVGIIEGDKKPDLLLGIIVKVWGKRSSTAMTTSSSSVVMSAGSAAKNPRRSGKSSTAVSPSFALMQQVITKYATVNKKPASADPDATPPGSPGSGPVPPPPSTAKPPPPPLPPTVPVVTPPPPVIQIRSRSASESPEQVEIDMDIIKRPAIKSGSLAVTEVSPPPVVIDDDDDEPYSPGGASDDSDQFADVTAIVETKGGRRSGAVVDPEAERIRLEMEEINRKIAEEKNEIVGILSSAELKADEIKSTLTPSLITDISIPSNLSEILASINKNTAPVEPPKTSTVKPVEDEEEYVPTAPSLYSGYKSGYSYGKPAAAPIPVLVSNPPAEPSTSKLSKLSDAELLSMVPDDRYLQAAATATTSSSSKTSRTVDDDVVELDSDDSVPPPQKKAKTSEPPPPGLEDEIDLE